LPAKTTGPALSAGRELAEGESYGGADRFLLGHYGLVRGVLGRRISAIVLLGALAACAYWGSRLLHHKGLVWAANTSTVLAFVLAAGVVAVPIAFKMLSGGSPGPADTIAHAREEVAAALKGQVVKEEQFRRINDPQPLPVRWSGDGLSGQFDDIHTAFAGIPGRRLVILGDAGSGKSALVLRLARDLLTSRQPGEPLPVLLHASTWTADQDMSRWIAGQLTQSNPGLADVRVRDGTGEIVPLAPALAGSDILPIIDGLDELPPGRRERLVAEINAYGSDSPLVLTSRPGEYHDATAATRPVARVVVVRLQPLDVADIKDYLAHATDGSADRWRDIFAALDDPAGPLATVLATPLMLWLARTVYEHRDSDPGELTKVADREGIEAHLITELVPAVYRSRTGPFRAPGFRCSPQHALRWLGFLAARTGEDGIAWWRLSLATGRGWPVIQRLARVVMCTCVLWWAAVWALTRRGYWRDGSYIGHGHYRSLLLDGPLGRALWPLAAQTAKGSGDDQTLDTFFRNWARDGLPTTVLVAVIVTLVLPRFSSWNTKPPLPKAPSVTAAWIRDRIVWSLACVAALLSLWRVSAPRPSLSAVIVVAWFCLLVARSATTSLGMPVDMSSSAGPAGLLRLDRRAYAVRAAGGLAFAASVWLWCGWVLAVAWLAGATGVLVIRLLFGGPTSAWTGYVEGRLTLALRGRLPWRTMPFLEDAHRRGVLRQVGAVYQFRHIRLRDHLATSYSPWPRWFAPAATRLASVAGLSHAAMRDRGKAAGLGLETAAGIQAIRVLTRNPDRYEARQTVRPSSAVVTAGLPLLLGVLVLAVARAWLPTLLPEWAALAIMSGLGVSLLALVCGLFRRWAIGREFTPGEWSVRVTPAEIVMESAGEVLRLESGDVERLAVRRVRDLGGRATGWRAVQARTTVSVGDRFRADHGWAAICWLNDGLTSPQFPPGLLPALALFAGSRLDNRLASRATRERARAATSWEWSASVPHRTATDLLGRLAWVTAVVLVVTVVTLGTGPTALGTASVLALFALAVIWVKRFERWLVERMLPAGSWTAQVTASSIEIAAGGSVMRLTPDDVAELALRKFRTRKGSQLGRYAIQVRLRPTVPAPFALYDGWVPVCWQPRFRRRVPVELLAALHRFAGDRFDSDLRQLARGSGVPGR
jgi:hypothetical protein